MTEATGPERVRSAEQIELSAREAAAGVTPRQDQGSWAAKVDRLDVQQRDGVRGTNVAGRRLTGPVQGFGKMWQKTYRLDIGPGVPRRSRPSPPGRRTSPSSGRPATGSPARSPGSARVTWPCSTWPSAAA